MSSASSPAISVIVPVYNVADQVAACIQSLRAQRFEDFEALVVDDGSTDGSRERAEAAIDGDPRFHLIVQENRGLSGARNTGLRIAKGAYIAFLDSDDRFAPEFLEALYHALEGSDAEWAATSISFVYPDGDPSIHSAIHGDIDDKGRAMRRYPLEDWSDVIRHFPSAWNKLYRRSAVEGILFDEGTYFEDHSFFYRVAARTRSLLHLHQPLYLQTRGRAGQITSEDSDRVFEQFSVLERIKPMLLSDAKTGGAAAFEKIASRLIFERTTSICNADRRARYLTAAREFLSRHGLRYRPDWDKEISVAFGVELEGGCPLSVVIAWNGADKALQATLGALAGSALPGGEVLLVCAPKHMVQARAIAAEFPALDLHVIDAQGALAQAGLAKAKGELVVFLEAGDCPEPFALRLWTDAMLRHDADFGLSQFWQGAQGGILQEGFLKPHPVDPLAVKGGHIRLSAEMVLALHPALGAKIFRRRFLSGLLPKTGALSAWHLTIGAGLRAGKALYFDWPGMVVTAEPDSGYRVSAWGMARVIRAIARTFPEAAALPEGWQRRLMARALWDGRIAGFGRARAISAAHGLLAVQGLPTAVGAFDQSVPQVLRAVCRVRGVLGLKSLLLGSGRSLFTVEEQRRKHPDSIAFPLRNSGVFSARISLRRKAYANFMFYDRHSDEILFHISVRAADNGVVLNSRGETPDSWRREIWLEHPFAGKTSVVLEVRFEGKTVRVAIDGQEISRHDSSRFPHLDRIGGVEMFGDMPPAGLDMVVPLGQGEACSAPLFLSQRLELRATIAPERAHRICRADGGSLDDLLTPIETPTGLRASLPGRVWEMVPEGQALALMLCDPQGEARAHLSLTRAELAAQIAVLLQDNDLRGDLLAATQILEHVRLGRLARFFDVAALQKLSQLAAFLRLDVYLWDAQDQVAAPESAPRAVVADPLSDALGQFSKATREGTDDIALLQGLPLAPEHLRDACLVLSEHFCRIGAAQALTDWAQTHGVAPFVPNMNGWHDSAALPFFWGQGDYASVVAALSYLGRNKADWLVTPAIGWVVRQIVADRSDPQNRVDAIAAFVALIRFHAQDYWSRTPCNALVSAMVAVLGALDTLPEYLRDEAQAVALSVYALSPDFWEETARQGVTLPPRMTEAGWAFAELSRGRFSAPLDKGQIAALERLEALGAGGTMRLRREVFGPSGQARARAAGFMQGAAAERLDALETGLRAMAFPEEAPADASLQIAARTAILAQGPELDKAPLYALQRHVCAEIETVFTSCAGGICPDADRLSVLRRDLGLLAGAASGFLGLGLGLRLAEALARAGFSAQAEEGLAWLALQYERVKTAPETAVFARKERHLSRAPAIVAALSRLAGSGIEARAREIFADIPFDAAPAAASGAFFDGIVTVFSCRANLETRIPAMRAGWLSSLQALGIPYVVVVGGEDGPARQEGDILHLPCPDDYEGLPQKTLAVIDWVRRATGHGYMVKVDDDCFLNADEYFRSLSYMKFDFYGRRLIRRLGSMDRAWHNAKASTARGRLELDKSPEPSDYCDGGSGYVLSRRAMEAVARGVESPEGQALVQVSFMEDKMLGDLLAIEGIYPENEDYRITVRRRENPAGLPVPRWVNGFDASTVAPMKLVHLDRVDDQAPAQAHLSEAELRPKKIWPAYQDAMLEDDCNALELISPLTRLKAARDAEVAVVACMRNEMFMLPHFLAYYRKLGVEAFLIADNCSDDGTLEYLADQPDVAVFSVETAYSLSHYGVAWQQALLGAFRVGKWSLVADADELLVLREDLGGSLPDLLRGAEFADANAARIFMVDFYPKGSLAEVDFASGNPFTETGFVDREPFLTTSFGQGPFSNAPTWTSAVRHRLIAGSRRELFVGQKLALLRYDPLMRLSDGLHYGAGMRVANRELIFGHFKYHADFRRKAMAETARRQHFNGAEEYEKYLALVSEGRDVIFDPAVSVPWTEAEFVKARLGG